MTSQTAATNAKPFITTSYTYHPETGMVSVCDESLVEAGYDTRESATRTISYAEVFAHWLVAEHMRYNGANRKAVNYELYYMLYWQGDGFGILTPKLFIDIAWDYSHIRDSSPEAYRNMAETICSRLYGTTLDSMINSALEASKAHNQNPLLAVPSMHKHDNIAIR